MSLVLAIALCVGVPLPTVVAQDAAAAKQKGNAKKAPAKGRPQAVGPAIGARAAFVDSATAGGWVGGYAPRSVGHQELATLAAVVARMLKGKPHGRA